MSTKDQLAEFIANVEKGKLDENAVARISDEEEGIAKTFIDSVEKGKEIEEGKEQQTEKELKKHKANRAHLENENYRQDMAFRFKLTTNIYKLIFFWLLFVACILVLTGISGSHIPFTEYKFTFHLSDMAIMSLFGATTVTVIGLFATVTKYFFHNHSGK